MGTIRNSLRSTYVEICNRERGFFLLKTNNFGTILYMNTIYTGGNNFKIKHKDLSPIELRKQNFTILYIYLIRMGQALVIYLAFTVYLFVAFF